MKNTKLTEVKLKTGARFTARLLFTISFYFVLKFYSALASKTRFTRQRGAPSRIRQQPSALLLFSLITID